MRSDYRTLLEQTLAHALEYLDHLDQASVSATANLTDLRRRLFRPLSSDGMSDVQVIDDLVADLRGGLVGNTSGRFFAWVNGGSLPVALAADWLTSAWDQNAGMYACAPAISVVEEVCGEWLKELFGLPTTASFALVTGGQMANTTCLAAARNGLLNRRGWNVERMGLTGAPQFRVLCGERHGSIDRAVRLLGLGSDNIISLPVNNLDRLEAGVLAKMLKESSNMPTIVSLQAGDINTGGFDPFAELIPVAHEFGAWVHVDGAFGLWAATSRKYKHLLKDVERADSWATDGHKWLNVPYDCGYAFVADGAAHRAAMSHRASYLIPVADAREQIDWNPEWSRRARAIATYAALRYLGKQGVADLIERTSKYADLLVSRIGPLAGAELVSKAQINQGLVRFLDMKSGATDVDHDRRTEEVIANILETGEAFFGATTWHGKRCMRVSVCNWQTNDEDVERSVKAVEQVLKEPVLKN